MDGGTPRGIFGHHKYSVSRYPQLANDPANIGQLLSRSIFKAGMAAIGGILPMVFRLNQNFF
jgi:hypothetical protein